MSCSKLTEERARLRSNRHLSGQLFLLELESPSIARALAPGQFVHLQVPGMPDRILRRPFSVYRRDAGQGILTILYQVVGSGTEVLAACTEGEQLSLIGPIGNSWSVPEDARVLLVGGGVGAAPLFLLAERLSAEGRAFKVMLGAQTKDALVCLEDYEALPGAEVLAATDDGSYGFNGFCTVPAIEEINSKSLDYVAVCGPEPVMRIVSSAALEVQLSCQVSLERRMACGVGACLSCVVDTTSGKKRCCVDGPIFDAKEVLW